MCVFCSAGSTASASDRTHTSYRIARAGAPLRTCVEGLWKIPCPPPLSKKSRPASTEAQQAEASARREPGDRLRHFGSRPTDPDAHLLHPGHGKDLGGHTASGGSPSLAWCCSHSCKSCRCGQAVSRRVCKQTAYSAVGACAFGSATLRAVAAGAVPTGILSSASGSKTPRSRKRAPFRRHPDCEHPLPPKYGSGSTELSWWTVMGKRGAPMHSSAHAAASPVVIANGAQRCSLPWLPMLAGHAVAGEARQAAEAQLIAQAESFGDAAAVHTRAIEV